MPPARHQGRNRRLPTTAGNACAPVDTRRLLMGCERAVKILLKAQETGVSMDIVEGDERGAMAQARPRLWQRCEAQRVLWVQERNCCPPMVTSKSIPDGGAGRDVAKALAERPAE